MKIGWVLVVAGVRRTELSSVTDGDFAKTKEFELGEFGSASIWRSFKRNLPPHFLI